MEPFWVVSISLLRRYSDAEKSYEEAIKLYPKYTAAYSNRGNALFALGKYRQAQNCFEEALRLIPGTTELKNKDVVEKVTYLSLAMSNYRA